jgi:hypothetical protein
MISPWNRLSSTIATITVRYYRDIYRHCRSATQVAASFHRSMRHWTWTEFPFFFISVAVASLVTYLDEVRSDVQPSSLATSISRPTRCDRSQQPFALRRCASALAALTKAAVESASPEKAVKPPRVRQWLKRQRRLHRHQLGRWDPMRMGTVSAWPLLCNVENQIGDNSDLNRITSSADRCNLRWCNSLSDIHSFIANATDTRNEFHTLGSG